MVRISNENLEPGLPPGQKKYDFHANLDVWGPVKVGRWAKKEVVLSNCVQSEDSEYPKTTPNLQEFCPTTSPDKLGTSLVPFNTIFGH